MICVLDHIKDCAKKWNVNYRSCVIALPFLSSSLNSDISEEEKKWSDAMKNEVDVTNLVMISARITFNNVVIIIKVREDNVTITTLRASIVKTMSFHIYDLHLLREGLKKIHLSLKKGDESESFLLDFFETFFDVLPRELKAKIPQKTYRIID